jgi:hypothetical protein
VDGIRNGSSDSVLFSVYELNLDVFICLMFDRNLDIDSVMYVF